MKNLRKFIFDVCRVTWCVGVLHRALYSVILLLFVSLAFLGERADAAPLRRPVSPNQPMWLVHIDAWNYPDPQKIIDLIPLDIRPYVVINVSMSVSHDTTTSQFRVSEYAYEAAKSWVRTCAQNKMWVMLQQSSGGYQHLSEFDLSVYEEFYRNYPNFIGFNYAEQFWGFDDPNDALSPRWVDRMDLFARLLELSNKYGGYLVVSMCWNQWGQSINPLGQVKRSAAFAAACRNYTENYILCEKYTQGGFQSDMESLCLGAYLSGYSGNYGIRYDSSGWTDATGVHQNFTLATGGAPHLEHIMLTGQTVIDGPELIWTQCFQGLSDENVDNGYRARRWTTYPQFQNTSVDIFRKILDGTVRIPSRQEVIDRTKYVIVQDIATGSDNDKYSSPQTLFEGLYRMDGDGNYEYNNTFFKKTGRYPTIPTVYRLDDAPANSFDFKINKSAYASRWPTIASKQEEMNAAFPEEYTGDIYAGRHENAWVVYNPYKTAQTASGSIPFKYNTAERTELTLSSYTAGVMKEYADQVTYYLNNYDNEFDSTPKIDTIAIYGATTQPTWSYVNRGNSQAVEPVVTESWADGVFTLTVEHNGPLDITVNCSGAGTGRLTAYTPATLIAPTDPPTYTGALQYEGECFDYKNISGITAAGHYGSIRNYTGQGYVNLGTNAAAAVRDTVTVLAAGVYRLETRYTVTGADISSVDLYVNGTKVATPTFVQTPELNQWAINKQSISLNAGQNIIEFRATATRTTPIYFDHIVVVPTVYGSGTVIQENQSGFSGVDGTIESSETGYVGTGYANTNDSTGAGVNWTLDFDASDIKSFTFRYASTTDAMASLTVNGVDVASNISFPSTGSLSSWDYVTVYAYVQAGVGGLKLQSVTSGGLPNIDSMEVIGGTPWQTGSKPFMPLALSVASATPSTLALSWAAAPGTNSYHVKRSTVSGGPYTTIATGVSTTSYTDTGLSQLTTYYYVVSAVNTIGESPDSVELAALTRPTGPPAAPTSVTAVAVAFNQVQLSWTESLGALSYQVKRSLSSSGPYTTIATGVIGGSYTNNDLYPGKTYYYQISAVNENGEGVNSSTASSVTPSTVFLKPVADTFARDGQSVDGNFGNDRNLSVKADGVTNSDYNRNTFMKFDLSALSTVQSAVLQLTPNQVDANRILTYELITDDSWTESGVTWNNQPVGSGTVLAAVSGYTVGTQTSISLTSSVLSEAAGDQVLSFKIYDSNNTATYIGFHSKDSDVPAYHPVLNCTLAPIDTLPANPTGLITTAGSSGQIQLSWTASADASSYTIERASTSGGPYTTIAAGLTETAYVDLGLESNATYYYVISAVNGAGVSSSSEFTATAGPTIAYLTFDEGQGTTAADSSGNGWSAALINSPTWVNGSNAVVDGALKLTSTSAQYASLPSGLVSGLSDFSIAFWANLNSLSTWARVFDFSTGTTQNSMYFTPKTAGGVVRFGLRVNGNGKNLEAPSTVQFTPGVWTHVVVTLSGNTATMYVNGSVVATSTTMTNRPSSLGVTTQNWIGRSSSGDPYLDGTIDDFRLFNAALGASQVSELFNLTNPSITPENVVPVGDSAEPLQSFDEWIAEAFPGQTSALVIGMDADPDADGYSNQLEYFLGSSASVSDAPGMVNVVFESSDTVVLNYRMAKNLTGTTATIQSTTDLVTWIDTGITPTVVSDEGTYYQMSASVPTQGASNFFVRLLISTP